MSNLTHDQLVKAAENWLCKVAGCGVVLNDRFKAVTTTGEQPDAIGWRNRVSIMIECKASLQDFLADRNKAFRGNPSLGVGDWRFFLTPVELIQPEDVPQGWGLLWSDCKKVRKVHGYPKGNTSWQQNKPFDGNRESENAMLYSALRRLHLRGHLPKVYEPLRAGG